MVDLGKSQKYCNLVKVAGEIRVAKIREYLESLTQDDWEVLFGGATFTMSPNSLEHYESLNNKEKLQKKSSRSLTVQFEAISWELQRSLVVGATFTKSPKSVAE